MHCVRSDNLAGTLSYQDITKMLNAYEENCLATVWSEVAMNGV